MSFRFYRRIKILPGIRLNFSRSGISTNVGVRGAQITVGHGRMRETFSAPGSGLPYTHVNKTHAEHSSEAQPHPVAEVLPKGKAWRGWLWIALLLAMALIATLTLSACGSGESDQEAQARDKLADSNQTPLKSCTWESVDSLRIKGLSHDDQVNICNSMQTALGRPASVALARKMSNLVFIMQVGGSTDAAKEITYQTMNIVEARGEVANDKAIDGSMETIAKIFTGSQGCHAEGLEYFPGLRDFVWVNRQV
jgi:hypothetical protein